jgi:RimJ/RimL family protein N-acetyltransferase
VKYDWSASLPDGSTVHRITQALLNRAKLEIPDHLQVWMAYNWGSTTAFLERGFGSVTIENDQVVSWSLADCVSGDACEIGIRTAEAFRRRGLATITAAAVVEYALSNGFSKVGWHCPEDNHGSIGTAEKVGFERKRDYTMYHLSVYVRDTQGMRF